MLEDAQYRVALASSYLAEVAIEQHDKKEIETRDWLPRGKITVGVTAGASCPNNLIEDTIRRLFELRGISVQELIAAN